MGLGKIRKYGVRRRYLPRFRRHAHGWAGWVCKRWKLNGREKKRERPVKVLRFV